MKLTAKEREALGLLRELDAQQRDLLLSKLRRAAEAQRITLRVGRRAGALRQVRTVEDHKIIGAYGSVLALRAKRKRPR